MKQYWLLFAQPWIVGAMIIGDAHPNMATAMLLFGGIVTFVGMMK